MTYISATIAASNSSNGSAGFHLGINDALYLFTFWISFISAGLGMAKSLKVGVCRILPEKGLLGSLLTVRFILIFLACSSTLFGKAIFFAQSLQCSTSDNRLISTTLGFTSVILPGLITGIIFIRHRSLLKTFLTHPSLFLLPAFTFFSFESNVKCCSSNQDSQSEVEISFSVRATCLNILFSLTTLILYALTLTSYDGPNCPDWLGLIVILLVGVLLTVILLSTTCSSSCCPNSCPSNSSSCSTFCCPPLEFGVYLPSDPHKVFIKDPTQSNGRKEIKEMDEAEGEDEDETTRARNGEEEV